MFNKLKAKKAISEDNHKYSKFINVDLPSGISAIYHTEIGTQYVYRKNTKTYEFISERAWESWNLTTVHARPGGTWNGPVQTSGKLGFRDGTLIQNFKDGKIYLVSDAKKRLLTAPLEDYGFDWADVVSVSDEETQFHQDGTDL